MAVARQQLFKQQQSDQWFCFQLLQRGFEQAVQSVGVIEKYYQIGDFLICLRFAGEIMRSKLHPAFAHLEVEPNLPTLMVCLWDNATSQTGLPYMVESLRVLLRSQRCRRVEPRGEIRDYYSDRIRSGIHFSPDILSFLDSQTQTALYWVEDVTQLPYYELCSPLRMIISWWLQSQGYQYVHAGAVGTASGAGSTIGWFKRGWQINGCFGLCGQFPPVHQ